MRYRCNVRITHTKRPSVTDHLPGPMLGHDQKSSNRFAQTRTQISTSALRNAPALSTRALRPNRPKHSSRSSVRTDAGLLDDSTPNFDFRPHAPTLSGTSGGSRNRAVQETTVCSTMKLRTAVSSHVLSFVIVSPSLVTCGHPPNGQPGRSVVGLAWLPARARVIVADPSTNGLKELLLFLVIEASALGEVMPAGTPSRSRLLVAVSGVSSTNRL